MLISFTKRHGGRLYIRAEDLRSIQDTPDGCLVAWDQPGHASEYVTGTADEVFNQLAAEERRRADEYQQQRASQMVPVGRGRPR